ncbi:ATP-dependent Clp protease adaptor ClpS [Conexibacter sp. DBS9H8]|uniref:ATP-dependent Clp protease adaptor ClpS n=1 Tax=Conexibacter sp. DBS9H8 TaxID=2937801 RepID=UPI00200EFBB4|nr:ATP-dependent Clp protease adaptor ClpS [Conexibacter sp. DBS9H8]
MPLMIEELPVLGRPGSGLGGSWNVVVLNDDHNSFDHVAETLARTIPGMTLADGYRTADRIHRRGLAIVFSGARDDAEGHWEALADAGLTLGPLESA